MVLRSSGWPHGRSYFSVSYAAERSIIANPSALTYLPRVLSGFCYSGQRLTRTKVTVPMRASTAQGNVRMLPEHC